MHGFSLSSRVGQKWTKLFLAGNEAGAFTPDDASAYAEMMRSAARPMIRCLPFMCRRTLHQRSGIIAEGISFARRANIIEKAVDFRQRLFLEQSVKTPTPSKKQNASPAERVAF